MSHDITGEDIHVHRNYRLTPTDVNGYDLCIMVLRDPPKKFLEVARHKIEVPTENEDSMISVTGYVGTDLIPRFSETEGFEIWPKSKGHSLIYYENSTNPGMSGGPVFKESSVVVTKKIFKFQTFR